MRDSLSLLDHVLACAEGPVTPNLIGELLGLVDHKHLFDISEAVLCGDLHKVLAAIDGVWRQGYDLKRFYSDLVAHFHHLTLVKIGPRAGYSLDLTDREIERMSAQTESVPVTFLLQSFDVLFQAEPAIKLSSQPKLALEMVFLKLFQTTPALPIQTLIDSLDKLQKNIGVQEPGLTGTPEPRNSHPIGAREPVRDPVNTHNNTLLPEENKTHQRDADDTGQAPDAHAVDADALWQKVMDRVSQQKPSLAGFLAKCRLRLVSQGKVKVEVNGNQFSYNNIARHREALEAICSEELGCKAHLELIANYEEAESKLEQKEKIGRLRQKAMGHPLVLASLELFGGRLVDIKVMREN